MKRLMFTAVVTTVAATLALAPAAASAARPGCGPVARPEAFTTALANVGTSPDAEVSGAIVRYSSTRGCWHGTAGVSNVETGAPVPANGRFRIGSITKAFTATTVLRLAAAGRIDLNQTVQHYLPGYLPGSYAPITVRQLLNYTHGLQGVDVHHKTPEWFLAHRFDYWAPGSQLDLTKPQLFTPGTQQKYDNTGTIVAGLLIEKITGKPYAHTVEREILRPLGLHHTYAPGYSTCIRGPHARGYEYMNGEYVDITDANPSLQWAAAEMISTAADLEKFMTALIGGELLPPAQQAELLAVPDVRMYDGDTDPATGAAAAYAAGIMRIQLGPITMWGKSGDRPGYNNGVAVTTDLTVKLTYSLNTLHMGGDRPKTSEAVIQAALAQ